MLSDFFYVLNLPPNGPSALLRDAVWWLDDRARFIFFVLFNASLENDFFQLFYENFLKITSKNIVGLLVSVF